jgi:uncharacterized protein (TIGR02391 family)
MRVRQAGAMARPFTLNQEQILTLPVDELALEILRDLVANESEWNSYNWLSAAASAYGGPQSPAMRALAEAWNWLYTSGLVATDWGNQAHGAMFVTRLGRRAAAEGLVEVRAAERLAVELHPRLETKVRRQFLMQEYELAAFAAMREVEIRVRELAPPPEGKKDFGTHLMRYALGPGGPLEDASIDVGERQATADLFAGAIGFFKNPPSHREVNYDDPTEAAEVVLFADLLLRVIERSSTARA